MLPRQVYEYSGTLFGVDVGSGYVDVGSTCPHDDQNVTNCVLCGSLDVY